MPTPVHMLAHQTPDLPNDYFTSIKEARRVQAASPA